MTSSRLCKSINCGSLDVKSERRPKHINKHILKHCKGACGCVCIYILYIFLLSIHPTTNINIMAETTDLQIEKLKTFLAGQTTTSIQHVTPSSSDYAEIRAAFVINPSINPPVIVRPQNTDEVALVTCFMVENGIEFTVRVGGHDMFSRAFKSGAVTVDLRQLNQVQVDRQGLTARIGGGTLASDLAHALGEHGLLAPTPTVPSVGYAGWAMYGGYGPYGSQFGLGVDQILGAKVVDHEGKVVEADADLLKGIRGAGGAFGIIVELTIPVFALDKVNFDDFLF